MDNAGFAGSLAETEPSLMLGLPLAKCLKVGAPHCPSVSDDIARGSYHQSARH